jgi:predicted lipid-binding transport protein (Tim44 family)
MALNDAAGVFRVQPARIPSRDRAPQAQAPVCPFFFRRHGHVKPHAPAGVFGDSIMIMTRFRSLTRILAVAMALALPLMLAVSAADARVGGGSSSGSRGSRTFSAPPATRTAPNAAQPMQRTITQPGTPSSSTAAAAAQTNRGGMFGGLMNRPGLLGGLAAGFLGAGLLGMLFGHGFGGGLGGFGSILGLILQIALVVIVARLLIGWWQRRNAPAYAGAAPGNVAPEQQANARSGFGFGLGSEAAPLEITGEDYTTFERLLGDIQAAWSNEDIAALRGLATPEMVAYFAEDLTTNSGRGLVN